MSLQTDIAKILKTTGDSTTDIDQLVQDEHARYQLYLEALALSSPMEERELIATILRDPDSVMAQAAIVAHVDRRASFPSSRQSFSAWAEQIADLVCQHSFLLRRIKEWVLFKAIQAGETDGIESLGDASDWLQRKLSEEATSRAVLEKLAKVGRTKRVRNVARSKARSIM